MVVVGTLILWNLAIDWLHFRVPAFRRFAQPRELLLIKDGKILERHLRREMMTRDELMSKLREHGVDEVGEVRWAYMESDGQVSVGRRGRPRGTASSPPP
jgi:uncharacterized membrane protein YcaP (DUF421 family)